MRKKIIIILSIILTLLLILLSEIIIINYSFKLKGDKEVSIGLNEEYTDAGYKFKILTDLENNVKVYSNVNTSKIGTYKVNYILKYFIFTFSEERIVKVIDTEKPVINLVGSVEFNSCPGAEYIEEGYTATDNYDGDLTSNVKITKDEEGILYSVKDSSDNEFSIRRKINYVDEEKPSISLKGYSITYVKKGLSYTDAGYDASDNCGEVNVISENNVDTNTPGTYTYTYKATDASGNTNEISRKVIVYTEGSGKVGYVYLTFDDGPSDSGTTTQILNVLKKYGVKATFFVTGKGSDSLIKREYDEGHVVALHTYSHQYGTIYSSVDNYFDDLNNISNRVYNITGNRTSIMRFPGGSNNTVSNNYSYGIMNTLTKEVLNRGYQYIDWNVSSGDAGGCTNSSCVYNNVINGISKSKVNIVLMHDIHWMTANALENIINYCLANNYQFGVITGDMYMVRFK